MKNKKSIYLSVLLIAITAVCAAAAERTLTAECCYVKAECAEKAARIYIDGAELQKQMPFLAERAKKVNSWHQIAGADTKYKALAAGIIGQDTFPFLLLLREDGLIEYVNVNECIESGTFKVKGKIVGLKNVAAFQNASVNDDGGGYLTICAVHTDGEKTDLSGLIK